LQWFHLCTCFWSDCLMFVHNPEASALMWNRESIWWPWAPNMSLVTTTTTNLRIVRSLFRV
jgi:hypothetical protein